MVRRFWRPVEYDPKAPVSLLTHEAFASVGHDEAVPLRSWRPPDIERLARELEAARLDRWLDPDEYLKS
jgi:hypothetical protein